MPRSAGLVFAGFIAFVMLALSPIVPAIAVEWPIPSSGTNAATLDSESLQCPVSTSVDQRSVEQSGPGVQVAQRCCKICKKGKACGNSCINRSYTCHQPPGCACDG